MALPSSGRISSTQILIELGYTSGDRILSTVRTEGGKQQANVNGSWINLNSCSPSIPKSTPPHKAEDWYNYDHSIGSIVTATISGNSTIFSGSTHTYTCSYTTDGGTGISFNWNAGSYGTIISGQGTNSVQIQFNFTNPYESQTSNVVCIVSSDCGDRGSNTIGVTPVVYYSNAISGNWYKNNCSTCFLPNPYYVELEYGYFRTYSEGGQSTVDTQAGVEAQNRANSNGTCYYNGVEIYLNDPYYGGSMSSDNGIRPTDYIEIGAGGGSGLIEFSFDNSSWFDANVGTTNLGFSRETDGGSTQVYARQKGTCSNTTSRTVNHRLTYGNPAISGSMPRNNCPSGWTPTNGTYNVGGNYYWRDNQADADAISWSIAQIQANETGGCISPCPTPATPDVNYLTSISGSTMTITVYIFNWNNTDTITIDTRATNSLNPFDSPCSGWAYYFETNSWSTSFNVNLASLPCDHIRIRTGFSNDCHGSIVWSTPEYIYSK